MGNCMYGRKIGIQERKPKEGHQTAKRKRPTGNVNQRSSVRKSRIHLHNSVSFENTSSSSLLTCFFPLAKLFGYEPVPIGVGLGGMDAGLVQFFFVITKLGGWVGRDWPDRSNGHGIFLLNLASRGGRSLSVVDIKDVILDMRLQMHLLFLLPAAKFEAFAAGQCKAGDRAPYRWLSWQQLVCTLKE